MARALINVPGEAQRGAVVTIRALLEHPMETGYRYTQDGKAIARDIVEHFVCLLDGETVFEAKLHPAVAANPYFAFPLRVEKSGELAFVWTDGKGRRVIEKARLVVSG
jgi:sulfur-oxidizing protein SoxZ